MLMMTAKGRGAIEATAVLCEGMAPARLAAAWLVTRRADDPAAHEEAAVRHPATDEASVPASHQALVDGITPKEREHGR